MGALNIQYEPVIFEQADQLVRAYDQGAVDAWTTDKSGLASYVPTLQDPSAHKILEATISKEPLAPPPYFRVTAVARRRKLGFLRPLRR